MKRLRIVIAGAGTTGLAAAAFLTRAGHEVRLFERFSQPRPLGAGILLQPTGLACLALLWLDVAAIGLGAKIEAIEGKTALGRTVLDIGYAQLAPHFFGIGIHRGALFEILYRDVLRLGVPVTGGVQIACSCLDGDGRRLVDVTGQQHGPFDLVVDATGLRSPLRREADSHMRERPFPWGALWSAVPLPAAWQGRATLRQRYDGASVMIGVLPIGRLPGEERDLAAFFWSLRADRYEAWRAAGVDAWRGRVISIWPEVEPLIAGLSRPDDLTFATYSDMTMRTPIGERLVIVGDAAHCTSPQLGQGANLGLADAATLTRCLEETDDLTDGLVRYAEARRRHVRFYQFASRWLTPFFQSESRTAAAMRDLAFGPAQRLPFARRHMLATLAGIKTGPFSQLDPGDWHEAYRFAASAAGAVALRRPVTPSG
jgi:2-polyprenyl-6-methoxyphenol hydroxylase-like FAD-dependent oxidoreductase